jgi:hypothetical protein
MFLGIFRRINPDVSDIDRIYPGQRIRIPLKIIPAGTLEGQATGTVTLPIIMISDLPDLVMENSSVYEVTAGDTVWDLIIGRFGGLNQKEYQKLKELVKYMNPELEDLNRIDVGDRLRLPESSVRNTLWYDAVFDESARLVKSKPFPPASEEDSEVTVRLGEAPDAAGREKAGAAEAGAGNPGGEPGASGPMPAAGTTPGLRGRLQKAARVLNAELMDEGDFFFPRSGLPDYRIDLDRTPVMQLPGGLHLLFDAAGLLSEKDVAVIQRFWERFDIVRVERGDNLREVFSRLCPVLDMDGCTNKISFSDNGITVTVRGEYIFDRPGGDGKFCVTFIKEEKERIPVEIRRYLAHHWIVAADWVHRPDRFAPAHQGSGGSLIVENVISIKASSPAAFAGRFLNLLGYDLEMNTEISFPYAGFQVKSMVNRVAVGDGKALLIDFGDLKGDAVEAIEGAGYRVLQFPAGIAYRRMAERLLTELSIEQSRPPLFWTADRRRIHNVSLRIPGIVFPAKDKAGRTRKILLPGCEVPPEIQYYLAGEGLELLEIGSQ